MFHLLSKHFRLILVWGLLIALVSGVVSLLFPKQYSAESQVLIISRDRSGIDPYTQAKSAQQIGQNLAEVMKTTDFYGKVLAVTDISFDKQRWQALNDRDARKKWHKDVQPEMVYNSSILKITVYSTSQADALALGQAVTKTTVEHGWEYVGGDVALKEVSSPLVSRFWAKPNLPVNIGVGFLVGVLLAALWVVRYKRHAVFGR